MYLLDYHFFHVNCLSAFSKLQVVNMILAFLLVVILNALVLFYITLALWDGDLLSTQFVVVWIF